MYQTLYVSLNFTAVLQKKKKKEKMIFLSCSTCADLVMAIWLHSNRYTPAAWHVF